LRQASAALPAAATIAMRIEPTRLSGLGCANPKRIAGKKPLIFGRFRLILALSQKAGKRACIHHP
jgi:hypothetical protein